MSNNLFLSALDASSLELLLGQVSSGGKEPANMFTTLSRATLGTCYWGFGGMFHGDRNLPGGTSHHAVYWRIQKEVLWRFDW